MSNYYNGLFDLAGRVLESRQRNVTFFTSYSKNRQVEAIEVDGEDFIVYDQYMGQTISMLNRILFERKPAQSVLIYAHKLMGEHFLRHARYDEAIACGMLYNLGRDELKSDGSQDRKRSMYTLIQEFFIIAHELHHVLFRYDKALFDDALGDLDGYIELQSERYEKLLSLSPEEQLGLHPKSYREQWHTPEETKAYKEYQDRVDLRLQIERNSRLLKEDPTLREELCCDSYAMIVTVSGAFELNVADVLRAVYLATYHLRAIRSLERSISLVLENGMAPTSEEGEVNKRSDKMEAHDDSISQTLRSHHMLHACVQVYRSWNHTNVSRSLLKRSSGLIMTAEQFNEDLLTNQEVYYRDLFDTWNKVIGNAVIKGAIFDRATDLRSKDADVIGFWESIGKADGRLRGFLASTFVESFFGSLPDKSHRPKAYKAG
jgi:hypothetical protein